MPLNDLILKINDQLQAVLEQYAGAVAYNGVAVNVPRGKDNGPYVINKTGEGKFVGTDDINPLSLYHKCSGIQISQRLGTGYGDLISFEVYTYQCAMIVFVDRKKVCIAPDELVLLIQAHLQDRIDVEDYRSVLVRLINVNLNSAQVFAQEYPGAENKLKLEQNIIQISYTIEAVFDPACLPKCS